MHQQNVDVALVRELLDADDRTFISLALERRERLSEMGRLEIDETETRRIFRERLRSIYDRFVMQWDNADPETQKHYLWKMREMLEHLQRTLNEDREYPGPEPARVWIPDEQYRATVEATHGPNVIIEVAPQEFRDRHPDFGIFTGRRQSVRTATAPIALRARSNTRAPRSRRRRATVATHGPPGRPRKPSDDDVPGLARRVVAALLRWRS